MNNDEKITSSSEEGRNQLISKLEAFFSKNIFNNNNQIRYPISFENNMKLSGKNTYLKITNDLSSEQFFSGHYKFGANKLYVYKAIQDMLEYLEKNDSLDTYLLEDELLDE